MVPTYAVPVDDVLGEVVPVPAAARVEAGAPVGFAIPDVSVALGRPCVTGWRRRQR